MPERRHALRPTAPTLLGLAIPAGISTYRTIALGTDWRKTLAHHPPGMELAHFKGGMMIWMWIGVATMLLVLVLERKPAASVGLRAPTAADLAYAPLALALTLIVEAFCLPAVILALGGIPQSIAEHSGLGVLSTPVRLLMAITEPVFEELIYRGFLIERVYTLTGSMALAVCVSAVVSSLTHGGWPLGLMILALSGGFAVFFGWRRNLPANVFMHFLFMCLALFVVPLMQR